MDKESIFYLVWRYIMKDTPGEMVITRKGLIKYVESHEYTNTSKEFEGWRKNGPFSESTLDNYRRMLTLCGYLGYKENGIYVKVKPIPEDMTTSKLTKDYMEILNYGNVWEVKK